MPLTHPLLLSAFCLASALSAQTSKLPALDLVNVKAEPASYRGRQATRITELPNSDGSALAILSGSDFKDGTIETEVAGAPLAGAGGGARGFIGIAFRVQPRGARFECFYLRPTNGRADDQLRRNHTVQYISHPDFPWERLRKETPGVYESYADLEPGVWTKVKIVVSGVKARLYVHGSDQPVLLVNDLKLGESHGAIALWIGPGTEGYFADVAVNPAKRPE